METNPYRRPCTVDILIRGYNNLHLTQSLIASIFRNTVGVDFQIIYVDNGSVVSDFTQLAYDILPNDERITICRLPFNHGSVRGINVGLNLADCSEAPYVLLLDNDTEIPSGDVDWLKRFIGYFDDPEVGAAGAVSSFSSIQQATVIPDRYQRNWDGGSKDLEAMPILVSFAMMLRKDTIHQVGLFDERFEPGNCEDADYILRTRKAKWKAIVADSVYIHHHTHSTFNTMGLDEIMRRSAGLLVDKWTVPVLNDMGINIRVRQPGEVIEAI